MSTDEWDDYDSGPYCQHWRNPSDCEEVCARCGHLCGRHWERCDEDGCTCEEFVEVVP